MRIITFSKWMAALGSIMLMLAFVILLKGKLTQMPACLEELSMVPERIHCVRVPGLNDSSWLSATREHVLDLVDEEVLP